jgi:5'-nucleotidase
MVQDSEVKSSAEALMICLLTNDDGIDAPGLRSLQEAIATLPAITTATTIAPLHHHSGCSHQITTHRPLRIEPRNPDAFAIDGTPVDCTRVALHHLAPETQLVLSGINAGGNLGADIYVSGTVAAVREAVLHGIPGIAISHRTKPGLALDWQRATRLTQRVLAVLLEQPLAPDTFWNVNLPHLTADEPDPEMVFCPLCTQPLPVQFRSEQTTEGELLHYTAEYASRARDHGADVEVCFKGQIAVTRIHLNGKT